MVIQLLDKRGNGKGNKTKGLESLHFAINDYK
jgi:hypothetical protein